MKETKRQQVKNATIHEFINLSDVRGSFLYARDNQIWQFLKVQPISTALMTSTEKQSLTAKMTREISPINVPFKIIFLTRPTDVRQLIEFYENCKATTADSKKRENLTKTIRHFSQMATSGGVLERQTFIALWTADRQTADELQSKTIEFRNALSSSGIQCAICDETEIMNMLGLFYNPCFSLNTVVDTSNKYTFMN